MKIGKAGTAQPQLSKATRLYRWAKPKLRKGAPVIGLGAALLIDRAASFWSFSIHPESMLITGPLGAIIGEIARRVLSIANRVKNPLIDALDAVRETKVKLEKALEAQKQEYEKAIAELQVRIEDLEPDNLIDGKYIPLGQVGSGTMGTIIPVYNKKAKRLEAMKVLTFDIKDTQYQKVRERFEDEANMLYDITNPAEGQSPRNIVKVYDSNLEGDNPFYTMEFLVGLDLEKILDICGGKLEERFAVEIIRQIQMALEATHQAKIVHRDLKPSNIMAVLEEGKIVYKLIDFGIAKDPHRSAEKKTEYKDVAGTKEYMAPEQAIRPAPAPVTWRTDTFSLGLIFHELLTGETPLEIQERIHESLKFPPELGVSDVVKGLILSMTSQHPLNRFYATKSLVGLYASWVGVNETIFKIKEGKKTSTPKELNRLERQQMNYEDQIKEEEGVLCTAIYSALRPMLETVSSLVELYEKRDNRQKTIDLKVGTLSRAGNVEKEDIGRTIARLRLELTQINAEITSGEQKIQVLRGQLFQG